MSKKFTCLAFRLLILYFVRPLFACRTPKIQRYYFLSMGPQEHLEWRGATCLNIGVLKVPFLAKMTKMPLVNLGLTESQIRSKSSQNNTFHSFTSNPSFLETFGNFDQIWPKVDSERALETLILIRPSERVKVNAIANIIKVSFQWLFMGRNRS